jgi:cell wall assembly regulator SMI1
MNLILQNIWNEWIETIKKIVPENNPYFNLASGISDSEIETHKSLENGIEIPKELIQLYQIHNVEFNAASSAFSFTPKGGGWYKIIPFKQIKEEWEGIQDLYFEDALEDGSLEHFDPKVKADDYANPRWIPFADGDNGDYLLFDTDPSELGTYGQIILLENETWKRIVIADSLEELIESQIEKVKKREPKDFWDFILENDQNTADFLPNTELKNLLVTVKYSTIKDRMPEDSWTRKEYEKNPENDPDILYYEGDLKIDYIDLAQPLIEYERRNEDYELYLREQASMMIFIDGNLFVNNLFSSNEDGAFGLVVTGSINAKNMIVGGGEIHVMEDLNIADLLWGHYNHGELNVELEIFARVILITDQYGFDEEQASYQSEYYFNEESENYEDDNEYFVELAEALFEPKYLDYAIDTVTEEDYEEINGWASLIQRSTIIESLKENQSLLKTKFEHPEPNPKSKKDKLKLSLKELVPICIKSKDKKNKLYSLIDSFEIDDEILENPQEVLDEVCEHLDAEWPNLFITIDHKFSVDDVAYNIRQALKENFGLADFTLPKEADYLGIPYLLRDVWIDFELALKAIDSDLQLTFLETDTDSYFLVLHKEIEKWGVQRILKTLEFESYYHDSDYLEEHNHKNVPILFENKELTIENYNRFFEIYTEFYYDEVNIVLHLSRVNVYVNKPHQRASNGSEVPQSIFFLLEDGTEIFVWVSPKKLLKKLFSNTENFEVIYKNIGANIFQYRSIFEFPVVLEAFKPIWVEFLTHAERSVYYFENYKQTIQAEKIRAIVNLEVVRAKYNDFSDADKMPWFGNYNLAFDWAEDNYVTFRVAEEIEGQPFFDMRHFYFDAYHNDDLRLRYWSSQNEATDDIYTKNSTAIQLLDYQLIKKATAFFTEAEKLIHKDNEKYLTRNIQGKYHEYYQEKPFSEEKQAQLIYENVQIVDEFCQKQDRSYNYDFFTIIRDYHWISVKSKKADNGNGIRLAILDEPFGNDTNAERYAVLKYDIEIDESNYVTLWHNSKQDFDPQNTMSFLLFELMNFVEKEKKRLAKEEKKQQKEFEKEKQRKIDQIANYTVQKPVETVTIQGQIFKILDRKEAEVYLNQCTDFEGNKLFDPFEMFSTDGDAESMKNGFFLLAETEMELESLYLDTVIDPIDLDELYILGYIFKEKLTIKKHVSAYDLDFSPPIICMADADIFSLYLSGNTHYFHQNLDAEFLHGDYNHGQLYVKEKASINFVLAEDFSMNFNKLNTWAIVCDAFDVKAFDTFLDENETEIKVQNYYLATHNLEEIVFDRFIIEDDYSYKIKDAGYKRENQYNEGEETFTEYIEKGGSPVDYDKLNAINDADVEQFESRMKAILKQSEIKNLNVGNIIHKGPEGNPYYFYKTEDYLQIGKWFKNQNMVVYVTYYYAEESALNVNYYESDNSTLKYAFETQISDTYLTSLVAKRIFREAENLLKRNI